MTSGITKSIQNWNQDGLCYAHQAAHYHDWLENLVEQMHQYLQHSGTTGVSPTMAMYLFNLMCMPSATSGFQCNVAQESEALNISNAVRSQITNAQNAYNNVISNIENDNWHSGTLAAQQLLTDLRQLCRLLNVTGMTAIFGASNIADLKNLVETNKQLTSATNYNPGHYNTGWYVFNKLYNQYNNIFNPGYVGGQGGTVPTVFSNITANFNSLNQSVSGVSSYIQTQVQFLNQNLQQYFSVYNNFFNDFNTLNSYIVSKSIGS